MKRGVIAALLAMAGIVILSAGNMSLAAEACSKAQADQAASAAGGIKSWEDAFGFHKQYAACDTGEVSEAVGDAVESLLMKQWDKLPEAGKYIATDATFEKFIVRHAGEAFSEEGAAEVIKRCASKCPPGSEKLCKLIGDALRE